MHPFFPLTRKKKNTYGFSDENRGCLAILQHYALKTEADIGSYRILDPPLEGIECCLELHWHFPALITKHACFTVFPTSYILHRILIKANTVMIKNC